MAFKQTVPYCRTKMVFKHTLPYCRTRIFAEDRPLPLIPNMAQKSNLHFLLPGEPQPTQINSSPPSQQGEIHRQEKQEGNEQAHINPFLQDSSEEENHPPPSFQTGKQSRTPTPCTSDAVDSIQEIPQFRQMAFRQMAIDPSPWLQNSWDWTPAVQAPCHHQPQDIKQELPCTQCQLQSTAIIQAKLAPFQLAQEVFTLSE